MAQLNGPIYSTQPASRARDSKIEAPIADFKDFFIFDHGERLGERGTRYNFLPYQWSARVPILVVGPGVKRGYVDRKGVSLVDLLPTLLDLAPDGKPPELIDAIAGKSLMQMMGGDGSGRSALYSIRGADFCQNTILSLRTSNPRSRQKPTMPIVKSAASARA